MIDVARRVELIPLVRMKMFCYTSSEGRPLFQRRVSPFSPLRLSFDVREHCIKAFERACIGMIGFLVISAAQEEKTVALPTKL
jgi:hypothetical protein